jgi:hypothetical protein
MPEKPKKEYTSIRIDPELWKEVKIAAIRGDEEVSEFMERAMKHELEKVKVK